MKTPMLAQEGVSIVAGKAGGLLVLDADPLPDIAATRKIRMVVSCGAVHDRAAIDKMPAGVKARVAAQP